MPKLDLHVHTSASFDCRVEPERLARRCRTLGLGPIAVTDHDTLDGARELALAGFPVIQGQEITVRGGELIGLFIRDPVPPGLAVREAALRVKEQGGLVYLQHPYDRLRRRISEEAVETIADLVDVVEVFNGRCDEQANRQAQELCEILGAAPGAGSDAHTLEAVGSVYLEVEPFEGRDDFLSKLRQGKIVRRPLRARLWAEARMQWLLARSRRRGA